MVFSQKAKCTGCAALGIKDKNGREIMYCRLGVDMNFIPAGKKAIQPRPQEPCYKPRTEKEVSRARALMLQREEKEKELS